MVGWPSPADSIFSQLGTPESDHAEYRLPMRPVTRRELLLTSVALGSCTPPEKRRPNVLFVMTDDHAAGHTGCYGNKLVKTPNIDRLAAEGTRFETACVTNSLCAPGRAAVLTGAYSHINGI